MFFFNDKLLNIRTYEDYYYNQKIDFLTKFNIINMQSKSNFNKITLNFGFKDIKFEKKKMVLFFFVLELITSQKCILTNSTKNLIKLQIKKGSITGCKITLREKTLYDFIDNLLLSLPRSETFKGFSFNIRDIERVDFSTKIQNLFMFYPIEIVYLPYINTLDISFKFNTYNDYEKFFIFNYNKIPTYLK